MNMETDKKHIEVVAAVIVAVARSLPHSEVMANGRIGGNFLVARSK